MAHFNMTRAQFVDRLRLPEDVVLKSVVVHGDTVTFEVPGDGELKLIGVSTQRTETVTWHLTEPRLVPISQ